MTHALLLALALGATPTVNKEAQRYYNKSKIEYNAGDFEKALKAFEDCFSLSHEPALLYNIASALQGLKRPHEGAEALRSYLRLKPDDPDRPQIEQRIRTLEEEQRLIDLERQANAPTAPPSPTPPPSPPAVNSSPSQLVASGAAPGERSRMKKRTALIIGLTAGVVVVAGVAIGLAFGLQPHEQALTPSQLGPIKSTE